MKEKRAVKRSAEGEEAGEAEEEAIAAEEFTKGCVLHFEGVGAGTSYICAHVCWHASAFAPACHDSSATTCLCACHLSACMPPESITFLLSLTTAFLPACLPAHSPVRSRA